MSSQQNKKKNNPCTHDHNIWRHFAHPKFIGVPRVGLGGGGVIHNSCFALGNKKYDIL